MYVGMREMKPTVSESIIFFRASPKLTALIVVVSVVKRSGDSSLDSSASLLKSVVFPLLV